MSLKLQININKKDDCVEFVPSKLDAKTGDQIFWTNNDDKPHWPGLPDEGEDKPRNDTFFMPNQIAPGGTSDIFTPGAATTNNYACSIHPDEKGTIKVTRDP